ncbi:uncharacterized protein LOC143216159 [Lasioglossum baleicum]|uniref:uncharacterized protein LOC143216159 n=1 Tax=Lasioglossum baleicum TaxID=434251 RepID=UPI003FCD818B
MRASDEGRTERESVRSGPRSGEAYSIFRLARFLGVRCIAESAAGVRLGGGGCGELGSAVGWAQDPRCVATPRRFEEEEEEEEEDRTRKKSRRSRFTGAAGCGVVRMDKNGGSSKGSRALTQSSSFLEEETDLRREASL